MRALGPGGEDGHDLMGSAESRRAFDDYRLMGINRSTNGLIAHYRELSRTGREDEVPTTNINELNDWARIYDWDARCAEHEAYISEKSEALVVEDRALRKKKRLADLDLVADISRSLLMQLRDMIEPYFDPVTNEWKSPVSLEQLLKMLPKLGTTLISANAALRAELGEDVQRHHVTIETFVNALPVDMRGPIREALYAELMSGPPPNDD